MNYHNRSGKETVRSGEKGDLETMQRSDMQCAEMSSVDKELVWLGSIMQSNI